MSDIYQKIWHGDLHRFSVSARHDSGEWENEDADILLDEQVRSSGDRSIDLAARPLFHKVNEEKFKLPTYASFIRLLDNYRVSTRNPEIITAAEAAEINEFLEAILETEPMAIAFDYIARDLKIKLSAKEFRESLQRIWFQTYTNYYEGRPTYSASGFEHIFVGEGRYDRRLAGEENLGQISGYHSWIKFYLDEKDNRVNFWGHRYNSWGKDGAKNPRIVCLQMEWNHSDVRGNTIAKLFKEEGGFFVGTSPECEIAMGTAMFYESLGDRLRNNSQRTTLDDANYKLVLFRNTNRDGSDGSFIRSFFPIFMGNMLRVWREDSAIIKNDGEIVIFAALPDPRGRDEGNEWVELKNVGDAAIDLKGWEMRDRYGGYEKLYGTIEPGKVKRFMVTRSGRKSMALRNDWDAIELYDRQKNAIASVEYGRANIGEIIQFYK